MEVLSRLVDVSVPRRVDAVVLVLHGGGSRGDAAHVSPTQLSVLRMIPTAHRIARAGRRRLAVIRLLNSYRGWDSSHTPVADVEWALGTVAERFPGRPVGLVGHSLGGRAALLAAGRPAVRSVVALNPWLPPDERPTRTDAEVLVVHGLRDRVAPASRSLAFIERLSKAGQVGRASFIAVAEGKHAMLRSGGRFDRYAAEFTAAVLLGEPARGSGPVPRVLAGERFVEV
jgi:pimeloyl-ACP methyl ester carboxylesterase